MIPIKGARAPSVTRYRDGGVTAIITSNLETELLKRAHAAAGAALSLLQDEAAIVAQSAHAAWYGPNGVDRETGLSGDNAVVTTIRPDAVTVGIGSTDARKAGGRYRTIDGVVTKIAGSERFVAVFVHRARRLSVVRKQVSNAEWWDTDPTMRANYRPRRAGAEHEADPPGTGPYVYVPNPRASDGKGLMNEFVVFPMRKRFNTLLPRLQVAVGEAVK